MRTVVGDAPVEVSRTEGHFGNAIVVLESVLDDEARIMDVLGRMTAEDLREVSSTLAARMDDSCHMFLRLDKQRAFAGEIRLGEGEDVIALRIKVRAFPAKPEIAAGIMSALLDEVAPPGGAIGPT